MVWTAAADAASWAERRGAMRVPVDGVAILRGAAGAVHGTVANLSRTGALINVDDAAAPVRGLVQLELRLAEGTGALTARAVRTVRAGHGARCPQVAVVFEPVDATMDATLEASIATALTAVRERVVIVLDDDRARRARLIDRLVDRGLTPIVPGTPLEAIGLLTQTRIQIRVCLIGPSISRLGVGRDELIDVLADSFPSVTTAEISDDFEHTIEAAVGAWMSSAGARLASA